MAMSAVYAENLSVVMALCETAVIFGVMFFKEAFGRPRVLASILIARGAVWLNIAAETTFQSPGAVEGDITPPWKNHYAPGSSPLSITYR